MAAAVGNRWVVSPAAAPRPLRRGPRCGTGSNSSGTHAADRRDSCRHGMPAIARSTSERKSAAVW